MKNKQAKIIYLDLDGVNCNFLKRAGEVHGVDLQDIDDWDIAKYLGISSAEFWKPIEEDGESFWENLELFPWTLDLVEYLHSISDELYICTSPSRDPKCLSGKAKWIKNNLGHFKYLRSEHVIYTNKKYLLAAPNTVLVDDSTKNVELFTAHGGKGLLFPTKYNKLREQFINPGPLEYIKNLNL